MKWMDAGPYPVEIGFTVCELEWRREMKRRGWVCEFPVSVGNVTQWRDARAAPVLIATFHRFKKLPRVERIGIVAHEATHLWQFIRQQIGETEAGMEVEACAVQWLTQWLYEQLEDAGWLR